MAKEEPKVVPTTPPDASDENLVIFFQWDELSAKLAAGGVLSPPWFRPVGLDEGELLLYSPIRASQPGAWEAPGAQVAKICGPTKRMVDEIMTAKTAEEKAKAAVKLVGECLVALPESFKLSRPWKLQKTEILKAGESYPAPWSLAERNPPEGVTKEQMVAAYVNECLPKRIRDMVHTGALCMAVPETEFMMAQGREKGSVEPATLRALPGATGAPHDPNSGAGSSTD